jgi:hypothetical protein
MIRTMPGHVVAARSPHTPAALRVVEGMAAGKQFEASTLSVLETDISPIAKQAIAGGMIELGAPHAETFAVLQDGLMTNDPAVTANAAEVLERVAPQIPDHLRPVFSVLLREQGVSAAFLH